MDGKVVIVTGATNGIGEVTALELARKGAGVVLISRNQRKLEKTVEHIKSETGNPNVRSIQADLSSMAAVRKAAEEFQINYDRLDVLVNNAGAYFSERHETVDGYEMTLALNHLNYFLLTHLLLDTIKQTAQAEGEARILNVSSDAHQNTSITFDDLQRTQNFSSFNVYGESKLMNVMFTYELARRLQGSGVTVNAIHPGLVNSGFGDNASGFMSFIFSLMKRFIGKTSEQGAATSIYLASSPDVTGITGKYWADKAQKTSNDASYNEAAQQRLWQISEALTGIAQAEAVA